VWLRYAARDLQAARDALRPGSPASPYHAAFWAQQAAEKALKGALVYAGARFEPTHQLNHLAAALPDGWEARQASGTLTELTAYGVEKRYPDLGEPEPTAADAQRAIAQAHALHQAVRRDLQARGFPFPTRRRRPSPAPPPPREFTEETPEP